MATTEARLYAAMNTHYGMSQAEMEVWKEMILTHSRAENLAIIEEVHFWDF